VLPQRLAFQLWAYTGLRTGELVALRWPRVDFEAGTIRIVETTTERKDKARPKTAAGVRTIPLLPGAREALELMRAYTHLGGDRVTVNPRSTRRDHAWDDKTLAKVWRAAHKDTGIAYRNPYQLRHTFASQLLSQGESLAYIAKLLGHKTVEIVTRNYARFVEEGESALASTGRLGGTECASCGRKKFTQNSHTRGRERPKAKIHAGFRPGSRGFESLRAGQRRARRASSSRTPIAIALDAPQGVSGSPICASRTPLP